MYEWIIEEGVLTVQRKPLYKRDTIWRNIAYYPRWIFAFLVSEKLKFYIVHRTAVRTIEIEEKQKIGAL